MLSRTSTARKLSNWQQSATNQVSTRWLYTQLQGVHFSGSLLLASVGVLSAGGSTHGSTSRQAFCQVWRALPLGRRAAHWRRELELEPCAHGWGDRVLDLAYAAPPLFHGVELHDAETGDRHGERHEELLASGRHGHSGVSSSRGFSRAGLREKWQGCLFLGKNVSPSRVVVLLTPVTPLLVLRCSRAQDGRERTSLGRACKDWLIFILSWETLEFQRDLGPSVTPLSLVTLESSRPRADDAAAAALDSLAAAAERRPHRTTIASVHLCSDAVRRRREATAGGDALPGPSEGVWSRRVSL